MNPLKAIEQLPLILDASGLGAPRLMYQAESGHMFPVLDVNTSDSSVADERALAILERMIALYNGSLGHAHNTDDCDPDGHVLFTSVCCATQLYRCAATADGLPSKPMIHQGEDACRECGQALAAF